MLINSIEFLVEIVTLKTNRLDLPLIILAYSV
jgi:hypothetical protein